MSSQWKKMLIKLTVSVFTLSLVFYFTDISKLREIIGQSPPMTIVITVIGYTMTLIVASYKWFLLVRQSGISDSFRNVLGATLAGAYTNCFGVGTIGGDTVRSILVVEEKKDIDKSLALVVFDRALGLAILAALGIAFGVGNLAASNLTSLMAVALVVVIGGIVVSYAAPKLSARLSNSPSSILIRFSRILSVVPDNPKVLFKAALVSVVFHLMQISLFWLLAMQVGASVSLLTLLGIIPFVNIAGTLPLSWMGVGVREAVLMSLTVPALMSREQALLSAMIWSVSVVLASAACGIVFIWVKPKGGLGVRAHE